MFESVAIDLYHSEAVVMDQLYESNRSIKKQAELFNSLGDKYLPDQVTYLVMICITDYLDKEPQNLAAIDKILNSIDFEVVDQHVLIALLKLLKDTHHLYKNYYNFYKKVSTYFNEAGLDFEKIIADI